MTFQEALEILEDFTYSDSAGEKIEALEAAKNALGICITLNLENE